MKSIWEVKNPLVFESNVFNKMKDTATNILLNATKQQYTQAIVLLMSSGNEYSFAIENALSADKATENYFIEKMLSAKDTEINRVLCLWKDGEINIPSFDFRMMLKQLNPANLESGIFVMTKDGYSVIQLKSTIK